MPNLKLWGEQELLKLRNDMDRLFDSLCSDFGLPCIQEGGRRELTLKEDAESIILRAELPGFAAQDVQVTVHERSIEMELRKRQEHGGIVHSSKARRRLELPCQVLPEKATASFSDGVLEVVMPKGATCRPTRLEITGD